MGRGGRRANQGPCKPGCTCGKHRDGRDNGGGSYMNDQRDRAPARLLCRCEKPWVEGDECVKCGHWLPGRADGIAPDPYYADPLLAP